VMATTPGAASGAAVTLGGDSASAANTANRADNRFSADSGGAVAYTGSVAVVHGQANLGRATVASVNRTEVGAEMVDTDYTGAMTVADNTLSASAKGNEAAAVGAAGTLSRGNAISFAQGIDVTGVSGGSA